MKRKSNAKRPRKEKEFTAADIRTVAEALDYATDTVRQVIRGKRNNKQIIDALHEARTRREKLVSHIANKF